MRIAKKKIEVNYNGQISGWRYTATLVQALLYL